MKVALGFRARSGWAVAVAVAGSVDSPIVIERRRIVVADPAIPGSKQPFHAAGVLEIRQAEAFIQRCRDSSTQLARNAVRDLVAGRNVVGAAVLFASGRLLPELAATLRSHALIHTAEGEFFREVLVEASECCKVAVKKIREREIRDLQPKIASLGKSLGPPWTQDEKLASLAAWFALADTIKSDDAAPAI